MGRIYQFKQTVTPSSGTVSFNTSDLRGILRSLVISPATSTTKWKVTLTNDESVIIYKKGIVTGNLIDQRPITLYGISTITIIDATVDEAFKVTINYEELQ